MTPETPWQAGLPHLDIHTLSEDWALAQALHQTWQALAQSLNLPAALWRDSDGKRMYAAVTALTTSFDLENVLAEDAVFTAETALMAIRKPHALSETRFVSGGQTRATLRLLTTFVRRDLAGSNKKLSKVRDVWQAQDHAPHLIDDLLDQHHHAKTMPVEAALAMRHEVVQIRDFNVAGLFYFKNFVAVAKAAEWCANRGQPTRLNAERRCFYFANVDDGDVIHARVARLGDATTTVLEDARGQRLMLSQATTPLVDIASR